MVQYADNHGDKRIEKVLCLDGAETGALASLLYMIAGNEIDTAYLAQNQKEVLMQLYANAYWSGIRIDKRKEDA